MATVQIACNIPGGLVLGLANAPNGQPTVPVVLAGPPATPGYGFTEVDEDFFDAWAARYPNFIAAGAVWEA